MIAYNKQSLHNLYARAQAAEAYSHGCIDATTRQAIDEHSPVGLYTPNIFIRIGLGLLTVIIIIFAAALAGLVTGSFDRPAGFTIFLGIAAYVMLELIVKNKNHYNSGVDNVLLLFIVMFLAGGTRLLFHNDSIGANLVMYIVAFATCTWLAIRFADGFMASLATVALLAVLLHIFSFLLPVHFIYLPAVAVCIILYRLASKAALKPSLLLSRFTFQSIELTALILLYLVGNVLVIGSLNEAVFDAEGAVMPSALRFIFWSWTLLLPVVYIVIGIRKKDIVLIRTGIVLSTLAILTFRHYFSVLSVQAALIIGGCALILISYAFIKYLHTPKHGFTFDPPPQSDSELNVEDMITAKLIDRAAR